MDKFGLLHITLYAKDWYAKGDLWEDLKVMFTLDDYSGEFMTKNDMINVILNHCQLLDVRAFRDLTQFASGIDKRNSYTNGYEYQGMPFQKEGTTYPEWDYQEAIVRYCLSNLRFVGKDKLPKMPFPDYVRGLKKRKDITVKVLKEHFGKKKEVV